MASIRLSRGRQLKNAQSSIILDNGIFNQFEQVMPIHTRRHYSEDSTQHPSLTDWYHSPRKMTKTKKTRSIETALSLSQLKPSIINEQETSDLPSNRIASADSRRNQQRIEFTYPTSIVIGPRTFDKQCSSLVTMKYRSDPTLPSVSQYSRRDEVTVFQAAKDGSAWIVFRGFLKIGDSFTFKSQRSGDDRFHLNLEINGSLDTTISACCEHPYRRGGRIADGDSSFWIEIVEQYTSCVKCCENIDSSHSSDNEDVFPVLPEILSHEISFDTPCSKVEEPPETNHTLSKKSSNDPPVSTDHKTIIQEDPPAVVSKDQAQAPVNESVLFEYANNVMKEALSKPKPSQAIASRDIGNIENFTVLCIDQNEGRDFSLLRSTINFIRTMNDLNRLETLLASCTCEKLIVIVSSHQTEAFFLELQKHTCVQSIYFLFGQMHSPAWIKHQDKIIRDYQDIQSIRDHLSQTLPDLDSQLISIEVTSSDSTSDQPFAYCQLLKETMLCEDEESDLKKDMLIFCRIHYDHNREELNRIDEFEKSFTDTNSIQWYTRYCFLTKIISRAFRTQEIDLLFKMRYFVQCLHKQIKSIALREPTTVYAILKVEKETVEKFQKNINGLVLFRSFILARYEQPTSNEYLILSLRLGSDCAANIQELRSSNCNADVLINIDTVFRIIAINEDKNRVCTVNLECVPHSDSHFQQLTATLREATKAPVVILQLMRLFLQTDHYSDGVYLTDIVYQDKSFENDGTLLASLASAHHLLGNVAETARNFEEARSHFFKSLRAFQLFLPVDHPMLSSSYNNIGSMFYHEDHHEDAIRFHELALHCQLKASNPDTDAIVTYSANIGAVYIDQKKYTEAIKHLERASTILEKMSTKANPKRLISIFQKISSCLWRTKKADEALKYYQKTLDLQLQLPDPLPHPLSVTYYNLSTAYACIGDYDEAVTSAEESVRYLKMVPGSDLELKENEAQLKTVQQKQWVKKVLAS